MGCSGGSQWGVMVGHNGAWCRSVRRGGGLLGRGVGQCGVVVGEWGVVVGQWGVVGQ